MDEETLKRILDDQRKESERFMAALAEDLKSHTKQLAESLGLNSKKEVKAIVKDEDKRITVLEEHLV